MNAQRPSVRREVVQTIVLAYREETARLETALRAEGLAPQVQRPSYTPTELTYSRTVRCLLNHAAAWARARDAAGLTLIVEADFVPCRGLGDLPLPFDPQVQGSAGWAFLYAGGPRIFRRHPDGSLQGHAACPVAYVISPRVAAWLCEYRDEELQRQADLTAYSLWDTRFQWHIMGKGGRCFLPWRHYGEHGGTGNPEHAAAGVGIARRIPLLSRLGLGRHHRAEVLHGVLHFLPEYAAGSRLRFLRIRLEAKLTAWGKLLTGRMVKTFEPGAAARFRLQLVCAHRLAGLY